MPLPPGQKLGRDVALKVLPPEVTADPVRLERFDREARVESVGVIGHAINDAIDVPRLESDGFSRR